MAQGEPSLLEVAPSLATLTPGGFVTFVASAQGARVGGVEWYAPAGSITTAGLFTAPAEAGSYQIQARAAGAVGSATAIVSTPGTPSSFYATAASTCANMPIRSTGTTYYVCDCQAGAQAGCVPGNDANAGTSPSAPKRRWFAALRSFNAMNAGDTVALCRGGAWNLDTATGTCGSADPGPTHDSGSAYLQNPRCAAGRGLTDPANASTCDLRDYQAPWGGANKPLLAIPSSTTGPSMILGRNGASTTGVRVMNLEFKGNNNGPGGGMYNDNTGIYFGSCGATADTSWLICNNTFSYFAIALHMMENGASASHMNIWGNRVLMSWLDGLLNGPGSYSKIDANFFDNNGGWGSPRGPAHTLYPNGVNGSPGAQIVNNEIRYSSVPCSNAIISGHGAWDGLNVENNLIDGGSTPGCWGTKLDSGNNSGGGSIVHSQRNAHIHRNWVSTGSVGIGVGQAPGAIIENNVVVMTGASGWKRGILIPSEGAYGWDITTNVVVRNNTIYLPFNTGNAGGLEVGRPDEPTSTGNVIANNAVAAGGSSSLCFVTPLGASAYSVRNNACYQGAWGTSYEGTSRVTANPLFTSAPTNFAPAAGSPLIGAGSAANAPSMDFALKTRPSPPSIGAYEP